METPLLKLLGSVGMAELVDPDLDPGGGAVLLPPAVRRVVGQRPAAAVDGRAEQRSGGVPAAGEVEPEKGDIAAVVEQDGADGAALAVDAGVLVVQPQVQV